MTARRVLRDFLLLVLLVLVASVIETRFPDFAWGFAIAAAYYVGRGEI